MLTKEDIQLIIEAEKEVFPTKDEFTALRQDFAMIQTSVDGIAKKLDVYHQEIMVLVNKVNRIEDWIRKASQKLGIEYNP